MVLQQMPTAGGTPEFRPALFLDKLQEEFFSNLTKEVREMVRDSMDLAERSVDDVRTTLSCLEHHERYHEAAEHAMNYGIYKLAVSNYCRAGRFADAAWACSFTDDSLQTIRLYRKAGWNDEAESFKKRLGLPEEL